MATYNTPKRKIRVRTYLTESEKIKFDELQKETNLSQAEYIRKCVLQKSFRVNKIVKNEIDTKELKRLIGEFGKVGSNINQISKHLNENLKEINHSDFSLKLQKELHEHLKEMEKIRMSITERIEEYYGNH